MGDRQNEIVSILRQLGEYSAANLPARSLMEATLETSGHGTTTRFRIADCWDPTTGLLILGRVLAARKEEEKGPSGQLGDIERLLAGLAACGQLFNLLDKVPMLAFHRDLVRGRPITGTEPNSMDWFGPRSSQKRPAGRFHGHEQAGWYVAASHDVAVLEVWQDARNRPFPVATQGFRMEVSRVLDLRLASRSKYALLNNLAALASRPQSGNSEVLVLRLIRDYSEAIGIKGILYNSIAADSDADGSRDCLVVWDDATVQNALANPIGVPRTESPRSWPEVTPIEPSEAEEPPLGLDVHAFLRRHGIPVGRAVGQDQDNSMPR